MKRGVTVSGRRNPTEGRSFVMQLLFVSAVLLAGIPRGVPSPARELCRQDTTPPELNLIGPRGGVEPGSHLVSGWVFDESACEITVNGRSATLGQDQTWSCRIELSMGVQEVRIEVTDEAGNTGEPWIETLLVYPGYSKREKRDLFWVETTDELLDALGSERVILLKPGQYRLDAAFEPEGPSGAGAGASSPHHERGAGLLTLRDLSNVRIVGAPEGASVLLSGERALTRVEFAGCDELELDELLFAHARERGEGEAGLACSGGLLRLGGSSRVTLTRVGLRGCGPLLALRGCRQVRVVDCSFTGGEGGPILHNKNSYSVRVRGTLFEENGRGGEEDAGFVFRGRDSYEIQFEDCRFLRNHLGAGKPLFDLDRGGMLPVALVGGEILGNRAGRLVGGVGAGRLTRKDVEVQEFER